MNRTLLRQFSVLSAFFGAVLGVLTLIPFVGKLTFFVLVCLMSTIVILVMKKYAGLGSLPARDSVVVGSLIGFVSFIVFCVVFLPLFFLLSKLVFYNLYGGVEIVLRAGTFSVVLMFVLFMGVFSATINALSAFLTFYVTDFLDNMSS